MNEELKVIISAEVDKLKKGAQEAQKQIKSFATKSKENLKKFNDEFQKVGDVSKKVLSTVGTAVIGAAGALLALSASTAEYRTAQAKLTTAFETAGGSAAAAKDTYNDLYRVLGDSDVAVEAAAHLAKMTTEEKALSEWTTICQGVYATFGDSLPIEGLTEAANETAKTGVVTGTLADALNWAGVSEDAFNEKLAACNTEAEREQLIRETLNGLYSDAASKYETNAAALLAQNEAQGRLNESLAAVGEAIAPINTALTNLGAEVLAQLTPYIEEFAANYMPQITEALSGLGTKIGEVITWIADNWDLIVNLGTVILGIAAACSVFSTAMTVVNTVMYASPITWIVAAVIALIAAIVLCIVYWDEIKAAIIAFAQAVAEWFTNLWNQITQWVSNISTSISEWWNSTKQGFSDWWNGIKQGFAEFWTNVSNTVMNGCKAVADKFNEMKENVAEKVTAIKEKATEIFNNVKETITNAATAAKDSAVESLSNMKSAYEEHGGGIKGIASAAMEGVKGYYKTGFTFIDTLTGGKLSSIVSKVSEKMELVKSKVAGILDNVKQKFTDIWEGAKNIVSNALDNLKAMFKFEWSLPKPKFPSFSVSGGSAPWGFMGQGSLPRISISWNALGGVFEKPTVFGYGGSLQGIAEDGAEAVVPLERNTEWINKVAAQMAEAQGNRTIVLTVDGKVFAQTSIDSINQLTRQTGALGLNLV